jgi:serine phosphatase RsbU (regulator of sigma subunit)
VTEAIDGDGRVLGVDGLEEYFKACAYLPLRACVEAVIGRVHDFREGVLADDDQLLLAISHLEPNVPKTSRPLV